MSGAKIGVRFVDIWKSPLVTRGVENDRSVDGVQQLEGSRPFGASFLGGCADEDERNTNMCAARLPKRIVDDLGTGCCGGCVLPRVFGHGHGLLVLDLRLRTEPRT